MGSTLPEGDETEFPLHEAAFSGDVQSVVKLLDTIDVNEGGKADSKPLHAASACQPDHVRSCNCLSCHCDAVRMFAAAAW
jgi:hypothetical protein